MRLRAAIAQLVERKLPKLEVASSNLVRRFGFVGQFLALQLGIRGDRSPTTEMATMIPDGLRVRLTQRSRQTAGAATGV
jgi:hypothetical protein